MRSPWLTSLLDRPCLAFLCALLLAPAEASGRNTVVFDPLIFVEGSVHSWSVHKGELGCFMMSPFRRGASRLAVGSHAKFGLGLYAVGYALGVPVSDPSVPVLLRAAGQEIGKAGRMVAPSLLLVPLTKAEAEAILAELRAASLVWLSIKGTWVSHTGHAAAAAADAYARDCDPQRGAAG